VYVCVFAVCVCLCVCVCCVFVSVLACARAPLGVNVVFCSLVARTKSRSPNVRHPGFSLCNVVSLIRVLVYVYVCVFVLCVCVFDVCWSVLACARGPWCICCVCRLCVARTKSRVAERASSSFSVYTPLSL